MRNARRSGWLIAAIAIVFAMPTTSVAEPTCSAQVDPSSGALGDLLLSVTGPPEHAMAVGIHFVGGDGTPLVAERVGDRWKSIRVPTEPGARTIQLQDATTSGARVWAVGAFRNDRPQAGWVSNGTWHWTHPIDPGDGEDELLGVTTTPGGTVWAVGKHQVDIDYQPLIERFDGTSWSVDETPVVPGSAVLKDVALAPGGTLYAVGWRVLAGGLTKPLVLRSTGGAWEVDPTPGTGLLSGIATQPGGAPIAVGWRPTPDGDRTLMLQRRSSWMPIGDAAGDPVRLSAVAAGESTVAVGLRFADGIPVPIVVRLTSGGWIPVDVTGEAAPETGGDQLLCITGELGSFLAVGVRDATEAFASLLVGGECLG